MSVCAHNLHTTFLWEPTLVSFAGKVEKMRKLPRRRKQGKKLNEKKERRVEKNAEQQEQHSTTFSLKCSGYEKIKLKQFPHQKCIHINRVYPHTHVHSCSVIFSASFCKASWLNEKIRKMKIHNKYKLNKYRKQSVESEKGQYLFPLFFS